MKFFWDLYQCNHIYLVATKLWSYLGTCHKQLDVPRDDNEDCLIVWKAAKSPWIPGSICQNLKCHAFFYMPNVVQKWQLNILTEECKISWTTKALKSWFKHLSSHEPNLNFIRVGCMISSTSDSAEIDRHNLDWDCQSCVELWLKINFNKVFWK